jgi:NADH:ubiquinone oxidoreductase subunit E
MAERFDLEICLGSSCFSRGNKELVSFIRDFLARYHLEDRVVFRGARCIGNCSNGPNLVINGRRIEGITRETAEKFLLEYLAELK